MERKYTRIDDSKLEVEETSTISKKALLESRAIVINRMETLQEKLDDIDAQLNILKR